MTNLVRFTDLDGNAIYISADDVVSIQLVDEVQQYKRYNMGMTAIPGNSIGGLSVPPPKVYTRIVTTHGHFEITENPTVAAERIAK